MHKGNRVLAVFLAIALAMGLCPGAALAVSQVDTALAPAASLPASGSWGSCTWDIDGEGILTVRQGQGDETAGMSPWEGYETVVRRVVFAKGTQGDMVVAPPECGALLAGFGLLESVDLSGLDTSQVTSMDKMFSGCSSLSSLDLSGLDTSQVRGMGEMFARCSSLATLSLAGLDTSNVTDMGKMFRSCTSLVSLDLSGIRTSQVTNMGEMFSRCSSLSALDLSGFDTAKVTDMNYMFSECSSLASLDISGFDTSRLVNSSLMLRDCKKLASISVSANAPQIEVPLIEVNGHMDWFSTLERKWFTVNEINSSRRGIADTYAKEEVTISLDGLTIELGQSTFTYDGGEKRPSITVRHGDKTLVEGRDYTVSYPEGAVNVGTYSVTITGMDAYSGMRSVSFEIVAAPAKPVDPEPAEPDKPVQPPSPDNPTQPSVPTNPSEPSGPVSPGGPSSPDASVPDKPSAIDPKPDDVDKPGAAEPEPVATQVMYRAYNPNSGEHFYTAHYAEIEDIVSKGWQYEGEAWTAPVTSATPVYRLYSGTDHHYTTSVVERDHLISVGWSDEGIGWYSDDAKGVGLHRLFNPNVDPNAPTNNSGSHHYTTSDVERDDLVSRGWNYEDFGWYGVK